MAQPSDHDKVAVQLVDTKTNFFLDEIGYLMTLLGEWERGPVLIRKIRFEEIVKPTDVGLRNSGLSLEADQRF